MMATIVELAIIAAFPFLFLIFIWFINKIRSSSISIIDWPVVGMLPGLMYNSPRIHDYFCDLLMQQAKYTIDIKGPWFSKMNFIMTSDPENIHYILSRKFINFNKGAAFKEIFDVFGDGILTADSDSWKMQRKLIHSLFTKNNFLKFVETITQRKLEMGLFPILDHIVSASSDNNGIEAAVDMQDLLQRLTLDVTFTFLLGSDLKSLSVHLPQVPFAKALDDGEECLLHRHLKPKSLWKLQKWLQVGLEKNLTNSMKIIDNFIYQQVSLKYKLSKAAKGRREEEDQEGFDNLISNFMTDEVAAKYCLSFEKPLETFLRESIMSILSAGRDTTATALSWFFWLVSTNPLVESKIREEIQHTFRMKTGDPWRFPEHTELNELTYLHATLCETLRLYPPIPFNHKASIEPDILPSGHRVNKETTIVISIYAMGRMEEIWGADYLEFKPERWIVITDDQIKGRSSIKIRDDMPTYKFNTFGAGPRTCVGKDLTFRQMKIVAAAIIWSYNLRLIKDHPPVIPANSIVLHMKHGLKVNVTKRC
ncbi:hypothetical protein QQ045_015706 [Rhodiola kirilowii]